MSLNVGTRTLFAIGPRQGPFWEFWPHDREGMILVPLIILITIAPFALLGGWAWSAKAAGNRPARVGLVCAIFGLVGVLAFWLSAPIIFGGLALTLGLEGRRRAGTEGRGRQALAAIVVGAVAFVVGAGIWGLGVEPGVLARPVPHSYRNTVATMLDQGGLSARMIADQLGYSRISMTRGRLHGSQGPGRVGSHGPGEAADSPWSRMP